MWNIIQQNLFKIHPLIRNAFVLYIYMTHRESNNCSFLYSLMRLENRNVPTVFCRSHSDISDGLVSDCQHLQLQWNKTVQTQLWHDSHFTEHEQRDSIIHVDVVLLLWLCFLSIQAVDADLEMHSLPDVWRHNAAQSCTVLCEWDWSIAVEI